MTLSHTAPDARQNHHHQDDCRLQLQEPRSHDLRFRSRIHQRFRHQGHIPESSVPLRYPDHRQVPLMSARWWFEVHLTLRSFRHTSSPVSDCHQNTPEPWWPHHEPAHLDSFLHPLLTLTEWLPISPVVNNLFHLFFFYTLFPFLSWSMQGFCLHLP